MPETTYTFSPSDFAAGFASTQLMDEIRADPSLDAKFLRVDAESSGGSPIVKVVFSDALTGPESTTLGVPGSVVGGSVVGDHVAVMTKVKKRITVGLKSGSPMTIAGVHPTWDYVGSTVGRVGFMVDNLAMAKAHITMAIRVSGAGTVGNLTAAARVRLVEDDGTTATVIKEQNMPLTGAGWKPFEFGTTPGVDPVPADVMNEYRLEACIDTAVDATIAFDVRSVDLTVLEVIAP